MNSDILRICQVKTRMIGVLKYIRYTIVKPDIHKVYCILMYTRYTGVYSCESRKLEYTPVNQVYWSILL